MRTGAPLTCFRPWASFGRSRFGTGQQSRAQVPPSPCMETTALVGAPGIERALILSSEEQAGFRPAGELEAPAQQTGACYGCALGLTEDYFAIGAPATDNAVRDPGTVYLFDRSATEMSVPLRVETGGATLTNYPNPFRTSTTISVSPKTNGHLRLEIFDVAGRSVALLLDSPVQWENA